MPTSTTMIHVRVDSKLKKNAARTLSKMGLNMSDAVRLLLTRIESDQRMPFDVRVPNPSTRAAMQSAVAGDVRSFKSVDELMAELHADD